jgi:hypothetical protein
VASVEEVLLAGPSGTPVDEEVPMAGVQLPRLTGLAVQSGAAKPLSAVCPAAGREAEEKDTQDTTFFPVPVVPDEC